MHPTPERPVRRVNVESELDIVAAVLAVRDRDATLRPAGAKGSKNGCFRTAGTALSFDRYNRVLDVNGNLVTAEAGITVGRLNHLLDQHGLALPTNGEWAGATIAGAASSGTHGGSSRHGIFATSIRTLRLAMADGRVIDIDRTHPLFPHVAVSFGTFGVISTLTFECVERFYLEMVVRAIPFERYLEQHETENRNNEFFAAVWFPTARRVLTFAANRVPAPRTASRRRERFCPSTFLLNKLSCSLGISAIHSGWFCATAVDTSSRILTPIQDRSQRVQFLRFLSRGWKAAEVAVPASRSGETLERLEHFLRVNRHTLTNPVGLRTSAADDLSLSPCYGQSSLWIDLFYRENQRFGTGVRALFDDLDARCHWGKHIALSAGYLRRQYPRWDDFRDARKTADPTGMFANTFTRRFDL